MRSLIVLCMAGVLAAGCGPTATSSGAPAASGPPSVAPGSSVAVVPSARAGSPVPSPIGSPRPVPPGLIAFDRYDTAFGAEGPYLGSALIRGDGSGQEPLTVPIEVRWCKARPGHPKGTVSSSIRGPAGSSSVPVSSRRTDPSSRRSIRTGLAPSPRLLRLVARTVRPSSARLNPTRSRTSTASIRSGSTIWSSNASLKARTTTPLDQPGSAAGATAAPMCPRTGRSSHLSDRSCGTGANPSADESAAIVLMNPDGTDQRELVEQGKVKSHPGSQISWSPDGTSIAFGSQEGELFLVDVETGRVTPIPTAGGGWLAPCGRAGLVAGRLPARVLDVHGCPEARPSSTRSRPTAATSGRSRRAEVRSTGPAGDCLKRPDAVARTRS